ncbi:PEGA domain-containing protein [bacterium]|nr:PEGA domain-containing protein [bacterium]
MRNEIVPPLDEARFNLPSGFAAWLAKFLEKDPEDRWQSAEEALQVLDAILENQSEFIEQQEDGEEKKKPLLTLPRTLLPVIVIGLVLSVIILAIRPSLRSPIDAPGMVIDNRNVLLPPESRLKLAIKAGTRTKQVRVQPNRTVETVEQPTDKTEELDDEKVRTTDTGKGSIGKTDGNLADSDTVKKQNLIQKAIGEKIKSSSTEALPAHGYLTITTNPWAEIFVEGKRVGMTPGLTPLQRDTGAVSLTFDNPGFPPIVMDTLVYPGDTTNLNINLEEFVGSLHLAIIPWATIYVDNVGVGETPLGRPLYISPGHHLLRFMHPEFGEVYREFTIIAGQKREITIDMTEEGTTFATPQVGDE